MKWSIFSEKLFMDPHPTSYIKVRRYEIIEII